MEAAKSNTLKNCSMIATDIDSLVKVNMKLMDNATLSIFKMFVFEILLFLFFCGAKNNRPEFFQKLSRKRFV